MKNNYLKKAMAGITAVLMLSSSAFPAVYAEETMEEDNTAVYEDDIFKISDNLLGRLDVDETNSLMGEASVYISTKGRPVLLINKLTGTEIKLYEGMDLPVDDLNSKLENAKIEKRDGQYVLVSETITANDKAAEVLKSCPEVKELHEVWERIYSGWKSDAATIIRISYPGMLAQYEVEALCNKLAPVDEFVSYYVDGDERFPIIEVKFESDFIYDLETDDERLDALNKLVNDAFFVDFRDISKTGIEEFICNERKLVYKDGVTFIRATDYKYDEFQLDFEEPLEVRTASGEKFIRFAGDSRRIVKVNEVPEVGDFSSDLYYYVEGENPYITYKTRDSRIKTVEGISIEPRFYIDGDKETLNRIETGETIVELGNYRINNWETDIINYAYASDKITSIHCMHNGNGNYVFDKLYEPDAESYANDTSEKAEKGDLNGNTLVDITDLSILSLALIGDMDLTDEQKEQGDVDNDGMLTMADLAKLRQFLSRKIETLSN